MKLRRWARDRRWGGTGRAIVDPLRSAADAGAGDWIADDTDLIGVGDARMVRTFRIGPQGELYPVNSATAWRDGWNTATCIRGHHHRAPPPRSAAAASTSTPTCSRSRPGGR